MTDMPEPAVPQPYIDTARDHPGHLVAAPIQTDAGDTTGIALLVADYATQSLVQIRYSPTEALTVAQTIRDLVDEIWPDLPGDPAQN